MSSYSPYILSALFSQRQEAFLIRICWKVSHYLTSPCLEGLKQNALVRKSVILMPLNKLHIIMKEACLTEAKRGCSTKYSKPGNWSYHVSMKIWSVWGANKPLINKHHRKQGTPWTSLRGFYDIRNGLPTANIEWGFYPDNNVLEKEYR